MTLCVIDHRVNRENVLEEPRSVGVSPNGSAADTREFDRTRLSDRRSGSTSGKWIGSRCAPRRERNRVMPPASVPERGRKLRAPKPRPASAETANLCCPCAVHCTDSRLGSVADAYQLMLSNLAKPRIWQTVPGPCSIQARARAVGTSERSPARLLRAEFGSIQPTVAQAGSDIRGYDRFVRRGFGGPGGSAMWLVDNERVHRTSPPNG
jgi:hypothetical protein